MNLDRLFQAGVMVAIVGVVWAMWPESNAVYSSPNRIHHSTYRRGPAVLVDRGHWNRSGSDPRLDGLVQLLEWDGYQVSRNRQEFVPELFRGTWVLVVADAMGWKGALLPLGLHAHPEAFSPEEVAAVSDWVNRGGALLLIADRPPAGEASQRLASAFGVRLMDTRAAAARFDVPGPMGEDVNYAMSFGGGAVAGPPGSVAFLQSQGVALECGRGRVVALTAQLAGAGGRRSDNRQLMLNIMHWLTRTD
jgi:hypothetical protein